MPPASQVTRAVARVVTSGGVTGVKVDVLKIAKRYAHVVEKELPEDVSGMLVPLDDPIDGKAWVIVVNRANADVRKRFTIAHELGHALMHRYTKPHADSRFGVRFRDRRSSDGTDREEIEANQFAAELLMPEATVLEQANDLGIDLSYDSENSGQQADKLRRLAKKLGVSTQALSIRLANLAAQS